MTSKIEYVDRNIGEILSTTPVRKSSYERWAQFNLKKVSTLNKLIKENPTSARVFLTMIDKMDNRNAIVISMKALSEILLLSRSTLHRSIQFLKENGLIKIYKSGSSNVYAVNDDIVWKSYATNRKFSAFDAKVILSKDEQENEK